MSSIDSNLLIEELLIVVDSTRRLTEGKEFPYLFSQCQPIYARSLAPLQGNVDRFLCSHHHLPLLFEIHHL